MPLKAGSRDSSSEVLQTEIVSCDRNVGGLAEGVKPGVSLTAGAFCEFALALVLNLAILYSMSASLPCTSQIKQSLGVFYMMWP